MYPPYNNSQPAHYPDNNYQPPPHQPQQPPPTATPNSHPARDRDTPHPPPHRSIGVPLNFTTGQFSGKHVRAELIELQKADLGRKYVLDHLLSLSLQMRPTFIHASLPFQGMLARIADLSIRRPSYKSNFSTRTPGPRDPMRKSGIMSCASFHAFSPST